MGFCGRQDALATVGNLFRGNRLNAIAVQAVYRYLPEERRNQRNLIVKWNLADQINLEIIKHRCARGYHPFVKELIAAANAVVRLNTSSC